MKCLLLYLFVLIIALASCKKEKTYYGDSPGDIKKTKSKLMAHTWLLDSITDYTPSDNKIIQIIPDGSVKLVFTESTFTETADTSGMTTASTFNYEVKDFVTIYYWPLLSFKNENVFYYFEALDDKNLSMINRNVNAPNQSVVTTKYYSAE